VERVHAGERHDEVVEALRAFGVHDTDPSDPCMTYSRWCALESVLKGDGRGLSEGMEAAVQRGQKRIDGSGMWSCGSESWRVCAIQTPAGFVGKVALSGAITACLQVLVSGDDCEGSSRILCASGNPGQP
jgi:hypothetical protein